MTQAPLTKEYFDSVIKGQNGRFDGLEAAITANTREIISHFNQSQGLQNERMDVMDRKLDILIEDMGKVKMAVIDLLATDRHLHNLVRELKAQGLVLDERNIFAS